MQTRESVQDTLASALSLRSPLRHIHGSTRKKCSLARSDFSQLVFACVHTDFGTRDLRGLWGQKHNPASARQTRVWNIFRSCYHATATDHRTDERISTGVHRPAPAVCVSQECSGKSPAATWNMLFRGLIPAFFFSPASHRGYIWMLPRGEETLVGVQHPTAAEMLSQVIFMTFEKTTLTGEQSLLK